MDRKIELMIKLNALKDVEVWLNEQYYAIYQEISEIEKAKNEV